MGTRCVDDIIDVLNSVSTDESLNSDGLFDNSDSYISDVRIIAGSEDRQ